MTSLSSRWVALFVLVFISLASSAVAIDLQYGSKVKQGDPDEGRVLSPFYFAPQFAFWDQEEDNSLGPGEPVYIHINPTVSRVSKNDVRITSFGDNSSPYYPAGSKVKVNDTDYDKELRIFGKGRIPAAEIRYFDLNGNGTYSIDDPVYLVFNHGCFVTPGDVRITGYGVHPAGSIVREGDEDRYMRTSTIPGMLCFYNADGDIDNNGWAHYGIDDSIYVDTQYPFYTVTLNDIRMTPLT
ncbi:Uncharacterised protein [uncultured archaeon]|nr:Uncharacterised protein [uncultured archaeon]